MPKSILAALRCLHAIDATRDSIAQASAIQLLRDRFAAYPEVRSFLAAYDEPHRTVQDKVAALLTPTRHHVISRAQHARVTNTGGLAALGFGVLLREVPLGGSPLAGGAGGAGCAGCARGGGDARRRRSAQFFVSFSRRRRAATRPRAD